MVDSNRNRKKKTISEGDTATLLKRYDMKTILKFLQEMAYYSDVKMDWNELVKKTSTGITNAREYQLLWRHLSYREPLLPVEDDAQPLDDDSDMECELEASPAVSLEASLEAIAHVKVMAASYVPSESDMLDDSTVEAPMTINVPYVPPEGTGEPSESPWSSRGMNITFPICLQKFPTSIEGLNGNGSASSSMACRRKRKKWSTEEDVELLAAVGRCGEGNWAHIVKEGDFKGERTAAQLSQRWGVLKKRRDLLTSTSQSGQERTEAQRAVNNALYWAVGNRPPSKKSAEDTLPTTSSCSKEAQNGSSPPQDQQEPRKVVQALPRTATSVPASKSRAAVKKRTGSSASRSHLVVTANSVATAACMGGPSTPASAPKTNPGKTVAPLVPKTELVGNASTVCMPPPSAGLSVPKVEPGASVPASSIIKEIGPANTRPLANGNLKPFTAPSSSNKPPLPAPPLPAPRGEGSASASRTVSNQRVLAASVPATASPPRPTAETVTCKSNGGQKEQARGEGSTVPSASTPLASASRTVSNQRVVAASVPATPKPTAEPVTCNPNGGQKEQARGDGASSLVSIQSNKMSLTNLEISRTKQAQTPNLLPNKSPVVKTGQPQSSNLLPRKIPVVQTPVHGATNQNLVNKPSEKVAVPSISGADLQSKAKCEVNNKVGAAIQVSSTCGKPSEVATVTGTGQGV